MLAFLISKGFRASSFASMLCRRRQPAKELVGSTLRIQVPGARQHLSGDFDPYLFATPVSHEARAPSLRQGEDRASVRKWQSLGNRCGKETVPISTRSLKQKESSLGSQGTDMVDKRKRTMRHWAESENTSLPPPKQPKATLQTPATFTT